MSGIASQITSLTIVYSAVFSGADQRKHQTGEFPAQKASDAEFWWVFFICAWINGWVNNGEAGDLRAIAPIMTSLECVPPSNASL